VGGSIFIAGVIVVVWIAVGDSLCGCVGTPLFLWGQETLTVYCLLASFISLHRNARNKPSAYSSKKKDGCVNHKTCVEASCVYFALSAKERLEIGT
jgi:hypothetical protein